jgi:hypothetical protein
VAVIACVPGVNVEVDSVARPVLVSRVTVPSVADPSLNVTVPP